MKNIDVIYTINSNNTTSKSGDVLLVNFSNYFKNVSRINEIYFGYNKYLEGDSYNWDEMESINNYHEVFVKWSYDTPTYSKLTGKPDVEWSEWVQIKDVRNNLQGTNARDVLNIRDIYNNIIKSDTDSFYLQFKVIRNDLNNSNELNTLDRIRINYDFNQSLDDIELENSLNNINNNSAYCEYIGGVTPGVLIEMNNNTFRPYTMMKPAERLYKQISSATSEMFGHCVRYFKTSAKGESADVVLQEYSLFDVSDVKDIKVLIPDNDIPESNVSYMPFDMDFSDGLEIHITIEHFERAFGIGKQPEEKDYLYFPLLDRIYQIHSSHIHKDFLGNSTYYKVMLFKWQDKLNVMRENPEIDKYVDSIYDSFEDAILPEMEKEFERVTKPKQYKTIAVGGYDHIRSHIHNDLKIENDNISNYYTIVAKSFYKLNNINNGDIAVIYKELVKSLDKCSITFWFNLNNKLNGRELVFSGYDNNKGIKIYFDYNLNKLNNIILQINEDEYIFNNINVINNKWYGFVLNINNIFNQSSLNILEIMFNETNPKYNRSTNLNTIYNKLININSFEFNLTNSYKLHGSNLNITNIRLFDKTIPQEKQSLVLNQYIVTDSDNALIIDNAIEPLRMDKSFIR